MVCITIGVAIVFALIAIAQSGQALYIFGMLAFVLYFILEAAQLWILSRSEFTLKPDKKKKNSN